jgi:threonine synthase
MSGLASNYGLCMFSRNSIPKFDLKTILSMKDLNYSEVAYKVLYPFLHEEISSRNFIEILNLAYDQNVIPIFYIQNLTGKNPSKFQRMKEEQE